MLSEANKQKNPKGFSQVISEFLRFWPADARFYEEDNRLPRYFFTSVCVELPGIFVLQVVHDF